MDVNRQFPPDSFAADFMPGQYDSEYRRMLMTRLLTLWKNVSDKHRNEIIKGRLRRLEKFNLARSLVEGDAYFDELIKSLSIEELEDILLDVRRPLQQNLYDPRTEAAYYHIYHDQPLSTPQLIIQQVMDAFGNEFANTLEQEYMRQHDQAVAKDPYYPLADHEFKPVGQDFALIFKTALPKITDPITRGEYTRITRMVLKDPNLNTYERQKRLFDTVVKLATVLENRGQLEDAYELRESVFGRAYAERCLEDYKRNTDPSILRKLKSRFFKFNPFALLKIKQPRKHIPMRSSPLQRSPLHTTGAKIIPATPDPQAANKLHELFARMAKVQQHMEQQNGPENMGNNDLTFAFQNQLKKPTATEQPQIGPQRPKYIPHF